MYIVTFDLLKILCPKTKSIVLEQYVDPLNTVSDHYDINLSVERLSGFLAQIIHESGKFNFIKENLNYSSDGLRLIFKKYFPTVEIADQYARQPEKIANKVYANRMGNGDEESGDGWKYRGRGLIQLTGKNNYEKFSKSLAISIDDCIEYMETIDGACASAGWFWDINNLNQYCDSQDFNMLTRKINGGLNGLEDRKHVYDLAVLNLQDN